MASKSSNIISKTSGFYLLTNEILQHIPERKQNEIIVGFFLKCQPPFFEQLPTVYSYR
ncbi:unnamed protein product, partial [Rotaria sp. Silwood2]